MKGFIDNILDNKVNPVRRGIQNPQPIVINKPNIEIKTNNLEENLGGNESPGKKLSRKPIQRTSPKNVVIEVQEGDQGDEKALNSSQPHFYRKNKLQRQILTKTNQTEKLVEPPIITSVIKSPVKPQIIKKVQVTEQIKPAIVRPSRQLKPPIREQTKQPPVQEQIKPKQPIKTQLKQQIKVATKEVIKSNLAWMDPFAKPAIIAVSKTIIKEALSPTPIQKQEKQEQKISSTNPRRSEQTFVPPKVISRPYGRQTEPIGIPKIQEQQKIIPKQQVKVQQVKTVVRQVARRNLPDQRSILSTVPTREVVPSTLQPERVNKTNQIQVLTSQEIKKTPPSNLICYSINKYYQSMMKFCLNNLSQLSKKSNKKSKVYAKILISSAISISTQYQNYFQSEFFKKMKTPMISFYWQKTKNIASSEQSNAQKQKKFLCLLIDAHYRSKLAFTLSKLRKLKLKASFSQRAIISLSLLQRRKILSAFNVLKTNTSKYALKKHRVLNDISLLSNLYLQKLKKQAFQKVVAFNLPRQNKSQVKKKPSIIEVKQAGEKSPQKSSPQKSSPEKDNVFVPTLKSVQSFTQKINERKDYFQTEKTQIKQLLSDLKKTVQENSNQISGITMINQNLKLELQKLRQTQNVEPKQKQQNEDNTYLKKLASTYVGVMNNGESQINIKDLIVNQAIEMNKTDSLLKQWQLLHINTNLRILLEKIQGMERERKSVGVLVQQNRVVETLVRSYTRQRYLWEWVKSALAEV